MRTQSELEIIQQRSQPMQPIATGLTPERAPMDGIRAVLFDVYGTLFCSGTGDIGLTQTNAPSHAMQEALALATDAIPTDSAEHLHSEFLALIRDQHRAAHERGIDHPEVDILDIWNRLFNAAGRFPAGTQPIASDQLRQVALTFECIVNPVWPLPGLISTLKALREHRMRLGIVSNAQFYTPLLFEALLASSVKALGFEETLCAWSYKLGEAKPSQRIFADVLGALAADGISPDTVVYVGNDMLNDIWTATQRGCRTILYAGDERSLRRRETDARCSELKPDRIVTHLNQVVEILLP